MSNLGRFRDRIVMQAGAAAGRAGAGGERLPPSPPAPCRQRALMLAKCGSRRSKPASIPSAMPLA